MMSISLSSLSQGPGVLCFCVLFRPYSATFYPRESDVAGGRKGEGGEKGYHPHHGSIFLSLGVVGGSRVNRRGGKEEEKRVGYTLLRYSVY